MLPLHDRVVRVRVSGELDLGSAPKLARALALALDAADELLLDLAAVSFIDSSGLHAIVTAARAAQTRGSTLALDSPLPDQARRVIEITGLQNLLGVT